MQLLQKRSHKHLELLKSLFIAFFMGGADQARKSAKKLKGQVNERDTAELLFRLSKTATDDQLTIIIERMQTNFIEKGII